MTCGDGPAAGRHMLPADAAEDWPRPRSAPVFLPGRAPPAGLSPAVGIHKPAGVQRRCRRAVTEMPVANPSRRPTSKSHRERNERRWTPKGEKNYEEAHDRDT